MHTTHFRNFLDLHWTKIICCFLFVLGAMKADAQNLIHHDAKRIHFGILLGFNSSRFDVVHSENFILHDSIKQVISPNTPGFNLGIVSNFKLSRHVDIRVIPTLIFAEKILRVTEYRADGDFTFDKPIESVYLDLPIGLKYKSDRFYDNFRFYVMTGGKLDYDLASNSKKRKATDVIKLGVIDYSAEVGFGFEFYFPLFIFSPEIKMSQGINNVHVPTPGLQYSDVISKLRSRTITISLQFEG